nr:immunoglobulin heavy chain junction region [Macaca mulatta]MOX59455.1 immunoglobulin heavy chain junction region [Macaca mulatta]MOX60413.1 immunoglobulin heavy chain junction region [Macaca mulatta]MOX62866.1 immunoglobulin heavy chain junction region [Macaca mulatta]MOX63060.1 immunoglobulin heavy chain junction region [Macaca mulatta]
CASSDYGWFDVW